MNQAHNPLNQTHTSLNQAPDQQDPLLTVREVARRLRVDDTTVRRWIKTGALKAITLPHRGKRQAYRVRQSTLDHLFQPTSTPQP